MVLDYGDRRWHIAQADKDGIVASVAFAQGLFENISNIKKEEVQENVTKLGASLRIRKFLPEEDKVYVCYNYSVNSNNNRVTMSDEFFAFKLRVIE